MENSPKRMSTTSLSRNMFSFVPVYVFLAHSPWQPRQFDQAAVMQFCFVLIRVGAHSRRWCAATCSQLTLFLFTALPRVSSILCSTALLTVGGDAVDLMMLSPSAQLVPTTTVHSGLAVDGFYAFHAVWRTSECGDLATWPPTSSVPRSGLFSFGLSPKVDVCAFEAVVCVSGTRARANQLFKRV